MAEIKITINGVEYNSYADAVVALLSRVKELEEKIEEGGFITEKTLETTLKDYAKTSDIPDVSNVVRTSDSQYTTLVNDNTTHNKNWLAIIGDLEQLPEV